MSTTPPPSDGSASARAQMESLRRRDSLKRLLARHGLTPAELARRIGLTSPNSIYNFLSGRSLALSQPMIEKILALFPDEQAVELVAPHLVPVQPAKPWGGTRIVRVTLHVHPELWLEEPMLPENIQFDVSCPGIMTLSDEKLIGALVVDSDPQSLYRAGSVVICAPNWQLGRTPPSGARVLVSVHRDGEQQITVREVVDQDGVATLLHPSMIPATRDSVAAPWAVAPDRNDDRRAEVLGVVVAAWQPESLPPPT